MYVWFILLKLKVEHFSQTNCDSGQNGQPAPRKFRKKNSPVFDMSLVDNTFNPVKVRGEGVEMKISGSGIRMAMTCLDICKGGGGLHGTVQNLPTLPLSADCDPRRVITYAWPIDQATTWCTSIGPHIRKVKSFTWVMHLPFVNPTWQCNCTLMHIRM